VAVNAAERPYGDSASRFKPSLLCGYSGGMTVRVLFVCLGNICRSPLAEAAFRNESDRIGLDIEVDSAGTGSWHIGHPPDDRAQAVARKYGADISHLRGRQVGPEDFHRFDHIVAMDRQNLAELLRMKPAGGRATVSLLLDHLPGREGQPVADPYYGGPDGFETTWQDVTEGARALARRIVGGQ
jgi:protein-tyrosine phosphatase